MNCLGGSVSVAKKRKANRMEVLSKRDRNWVQTSSIELQTDWRDLDARHKMFGKISILLTAKYVTVSGVEKRKCKKKQ